MKTLTKVLYPYHRSRESRPTNVEFNPLYVDRHAALLHLELERKDNCVVITEMTGKMSYVTIAHKESLNALTACNCTLSLGRRLGWFDSLVNGAQP